MMSQVVPTDTLAGALALLDPKKVKAELEKLAAAKADVDARLADLAERLFKFNQAKAEFAKERDAHALAVRAHEKQASELEQLRVEHANAVQAFGLAEAKHMEDKAARNMAFQQRETALAKRERVVAERGHELEANSAQLEEWEQKLTRRQAMIESAEAEHQARLARLREAIA